MERTEKTCLLEIVVAAIVAAMLAALVGLVGWTATKVVQNGERILEVRLELQQQIAENRQEIAENRRQIAEVNGKVAEINGKIAEINGKMDLIISGLNISVAPKESADAGLPGAERGFQVGAGGAATE